MVVFGQIGSNWENWFYLRKVIVFVQNVSFWANWFYLSKLVLFEKGGGNLKF